MKQYLKSGMMLKGQRFWHQRNLWRDTVNLCKNFLGILKYEDNQ